jgi:DDE superfamily endonuclease/Tc5 transposase DNA-binding domain
MTAFFEQKIAQALEDLDNQRFPSVRAAAKAHNIPPTTLNRRIKGGISKQEARTTQQLLSQHQEELLVKWILDLEAGGFAPSHGQIREMAALVSKDSGGPENIGVNWVHRFLKRWPRIHTKTGVKIDAQRLQNTTPEALEAWFKQFKAVQTTNQVELVDTWNMDETGTALGVCTNQTVVGDSSTTRSYKKSPENREWVSSIETVSATGRRTRSLIIFKGKSLQSTWFKHDKVPDWLYTTSENGWTSNDTGLRWLHDIFLPETERDGKPRILLLDGHGSHATTQFMWDCRQNNVHLVYLIAHSSHVLQPLDLSCFSVIKSRYRAQIADLARFEDSAPVKKIRFVEYYNKARNEGLTRQNILAGWAAAGISPWNPRKVIKSSQLAANNQINQPPPLAPGKSEISASEQVVATPRNRRELLKAIQTVSNEEAISRPVRHLLAKTSKAFDTLHHRHSEDSLQIEALQKKNDELAAKRKKKVAIDCNQVFADITRIKAAQEEADRQRKTWEEQDRAAEARRTANAMLAKQIAQFQHEFHVLDCN